MGRPNQRGDEPVKIEKLDRVVVYVENLDASKELFSKLLGITFDEIPFAEVEPQKIEPGPKAIEQASEQAGAAQAQRLQRVAISREGLELIEGGLEPGEQPFIRCFHFKVSDYEGAKREMEAKGVPLLVDIQLGTLREAIYPPDELGGPMMGLVAYDTPHVMDAIKTKG
jgi:hypothetical protein